MSIRAAAWKLASPYDAYVSHVARLNEAIAHLEYLSEQALGLETGLRASVRFVPEREHAGRTENMRARLEAAAPELSEAEFEDFLTHLGAGANANVEADRARAASRLTQITRVMAGHFATAANELSTLEARGYNPHRADVARQLRENHLPETTVDEFRHRLRELGARVSQAV